jgi:hypothetical protein
MTISLRPRCCPFDGYNRPCAWNRPLVLGRSQEAVGCVALRIGIRSCTNCTLPHSSLVRLAHSSLETPCSLVVEKKKTSPSKPGRLSGF